jgi:hypothetical protein
VRVRVGTSEIVPYPRREDDPVRGGMGRVLHGTSGRSCDSGTRPFRRGRRKGASVIGTMSRAGPDSCLSLMG